jgi:hypothetical protein
MIKMLLVAAVFNPIGREPINIGGISEFLNMNSTQDNGLIAAAKFSNKSGHSKEEALKKAGIPVELANLQKIRDVAHALNTNFVNPSQVNIELNNDKKAVHDLDGKAMVELAKLKQS